MRRVLLGLAAGLMLVTSGCGAVHPKASKPPKVSTTPIATSGIGTQSIQPLPETLSAGLVEVTESGNVVYWNPSPSLGANFTWNGIGLWNPVSGQKTILFSDRSGYFPLTAKVDHQYAVALYLPGTSSSFNQLSPGWKIVALDRSTGQEWIVASDQTGMLQGTKIPTSVAPVMSLAGNELVWTQFEGNPGAYTDTLHIENLATRQSRTILTVASAPQYGIDQPAIQGNFIAFSLSRINYGSSVSATEVLVLRNWQTNRTLWSVWGGKEPAFDPNATTVYFWKNNSIYRRPTSPESKVELYAQAVTGDMFWNPKVGDAFVAWAAEAQPWGRSRKNGDWLSLPNSQSINIVQTGGNTLAWSNISAPGQVPIPTIHVYIAGAR